EVLQICQRARRLAAGVDRRRRLTEIDGSLYDRNRESELRGGRIHRAVVRGDDPADLLRRQVARPPVQAVLYHYESWSADEREHTPARRRARGAATSSEPAALASADER